MHTTSRRLVLMRHGKAVSWSSEDHSRDLEPSGREDARRVGQWLAENDVVPDQALVSSAVRTSSTWREVSAAGNFTCPVDTTHALYSAEPDTALDLVRAVDSGVRCLVVVGHNPTIAFLAQLLDSGEGDPAEAESMMVGFPPASLALFDFDGEWSGLAPTGAVLTTFRPAVPE